jgi:hypothetical protein
MQHTSPPTTHLINIDQRELRATTREVELLIWHPDAQEITNIDCLQVTHHHNDVIYYFGTKL